MWSNFSGFYQQFPLFCCVFYSDFICCLLQRKGLQIAYTEGPGAKMCSTSGTSHFLSFVQKTTGSCSKPTKGNTVEPTKLSSAAKQQNPSLLLDIFNEDSKEKDEEPSHGDLTVINETDAMREVMDEIFSTIYKLKISYTQLQAAHVPYNVEKLQMADKGVIKEMKRLSELKHYYNEHVARFGHGFVDEEASKAAVERKDMEIKVLKIALEKTRMKNQELQRRLRKNLKKDIVNNSPMVKLLELNVQMARESARGFTECLLSLMKQAQWDLDAAAGSIEPDMNYTKPGHKEFAFESYVTMKMFQGFENETFYLTGTLSSVMDAEKHRKECLAQFQSMQNMEPLEVVSVAPDCLFGKFCLKKFLQVVHPKMEESFFGSFEHRNEIVNGVHPRSPFYSAFLKFAKAVWLVHKLVFYLDPPASIFHVRRGVQFNGLYMENLDLEHNNGDQIIQQQQEPGKKVGFTVMPGFRLGNKTFLKCQVYAPTSPGYPTVL